MVIFMPKPALLKLRPYGAIQICLLLLLLSVYPFRQNTYDRQLDGQNHEAGLHRACIAYNKAEDAKQQ